jgi:hypothetical protein
MSLDLIPVLLLSILLMTADGDVRTAELIFGGAHDATAHRAGLIVGDGQVTVPADVEVPGPVHLLGGETRVLGTVDGDVTQIAGSLVVEDGARIAGTLEHVGGALVVSGGADVVRRTSLDLVPRDAGAIERVGPLVVLTGLLAFVGARRAQRRPRTLANLRAAVEHHPIVSLTVGGLATVTFLSLFVFMAFTLILMP